MKGTRRLGLRIEKGNDFNQIPQLIGKVDANWGGDKDSISISGWCMSIHSGKIIDESILTEKWSTANLINHVSKRQSLFIADSSEAAETAALNESLKDIEWLRNLLEEIGFPQEGPTLIFGDNTASVIKAMDDKMNSKNRHHRRKFNEVRLKRQLGLMKMIAIKSEDNDANTFTKGEDFGTHERFIARNMGYAIVEK